ncbi:hypothetical protein SAMN05216167_12463 [Spirosoma endophyticum]|uniref:Uncharacterized protein n=1 Tax=Spirosoma endophyticum TaxID=662367 RepID=A0A1I2F614_9BACT|nr:hypothetical protein SAMN05216167_12463 [Spirosoma endophyticum]
MKTHFEVINSSSDEVNVDRALKNWIKAVATFHECYSKLAAHMSQKELHRHMPKFLYVGQCSKRQITTLLKRMGSELERLIQDMDRGEGTNQLSTPMDFRKLVQHTCLLNRLNDQARIRLHLISQPAS